MALIPSPKNMWVIVSSQRARESLVSPRPLGEGGGEGDLVVAPKS